MTELELIGQKAWERKNGKSGEWPKTVTFNRPGKYICYITDEITYVDHRGMGLNYSQRKKRMEIESQYKKAWK